MLKDRDAYSDREVSALLEAAVLTGNLVGIAQFEALKRALPWEALSGLLRQGDELIGRFEQEATALRGRRVEVQKLIDEQTAKFDGDGKSVFVQVFARTVPTSPETRDRPDGDIRAELRTASAEMEQKAILADEWRSDLTRDVEYGRQVVRNFASNQTGDFAAPVRSVIDRLHVAFSDAQGRLQQLHVVPNAAIEAFRSGEVRSLDDPRMVRLGGVTE